MSNTDSLSMKNEVGDKKKKKGDKTIELLKKNMNEFKTEEERIAYLCDRYSELFHDYKELKATNQTSKKQLTSAQKEKEQLTKDYHKILLQKANLENLSRELQKQKQNIQDESINRHKLEEERRKEISDLFRTKITEIECQMTSYQESNDKLRQENMDLAGKLSKFIEQFELKEQHNAKVLQTKQLEQQLIDAKFQQSQACLEEMMTKVKIDKEQVNRQLEEYVGKIRVHEELESKMKEQIEFYRSRYEEFQTTMTESNQVFATCKTEMEKMSSSIKRLEKDNQQLRKKWENSNCSALTLASEKAKSDEHIQQLKSKIDKLESLCRALQLERTELRKKITSVSDDKSKSNELKEVEQSHESSGEDVNEEKKGDANEEERKGSGDQEVIGTIGEEAAASTPLSLSSDQNSSNVNN